MDSKAAFEERTMNVFEVRPDFAYQTFYTSDPDQSDAEEEYRINGEPLLASWRQMPLFPADPERKVGNFSHCWDGGLILDENACSVLKPILKATVEFLPLQRYKKNAYYLLNVLACLNCLDEERTKWRIGKQHGARIGIAEYQFVPSSLEGATLFRVPRKSALFAVVGTRSGEPEFKTVVERQGLTGLSFERVWSESGPPIQIKTLAQRLKASSDPNLDR